MKLKVSLIFIFFPSSTLAVFSDRLDWFPLGTNLWLHSLLAACWKPHVLTETLETLEVFLVPHQAELRPAQTRQTSTSRRKLGLNISVMIDKKKKCSDFAVKLADVAQKKAHILLNRTSKNLQTVHTPALSSVVHYLDHCTKL